MTYLEQMNPRDGKQALAGCQQITGKRWGKGLMDKETGGCELEADRGGSLQSCVEMLTATDFFTLYKGLILKLF